MNCLFSSRRSTAYPTLCAAAIACVLALAGCSKHDAVAAGRAHLAKGDYVSAVIELKTAVQAEPESAPLRVLLADALERQHDLAGVEQHLLRALGSGGDENILVPRIALLMLDRNEGEKLIRTFKDRRLADPVGQSNLRGALALAYLGTKRPAQADEQLKDVVDSPVANLARAQVLAQAGKPLDALAKLGLASGEGNAPWWVLRAAKRMAAAAGDQDKALSFIKRAHAEVPWHLGVKGEYGEAEMVAGNTEAAANVRDALRKAAPNYFWTFYLDAMLQARAGRTEESHAAALNVLKTQPEHLAAGLLVASAELQKSELLSADKRLQTLARTYPDALPILRLAAQTQLRLGRAKAAAATVKQGLSLAPNDPQLLATKADLELSSGQPLLAAATLAALLVARPNDADAMLRLAQVRAKLGDGAGATQMLDRAANAAPGDGALQARIVATALRMNNLARARKFADNAVAAMPGDAQARLSLAAVQAAQNDKAGAWATTLAVVDKAPATPNGLAALAAIARTPEERRELMSRQAKAIEAGVGNAQVYTDHAALLRFEASDDKQALAVLEAGVKAIPGSVPLREALVEAHLRSGDADKAISAAQSGAAVSNAASDASALLAATYERLGKTAQATETYRKLANDYPQRADWRLKLAQLEAAANRSKESIAILRALIAERPDELPAYLALATLSVKGNADEALSIAREMGRRDELKVAAMLLEGDLLQRSGKEEAALVQFGKAAKAGALPVALLRTVKLLDQTGRTNAADEALADAMRRFPDDAAVFGLAAQRAQAAGQAAKAVDYLQRLAAKSPNDPYLLNDLAWAQLAAGRPEALGNARRAAAALPNNANALHTLGLALAKAGKQGEAIALLRISANLSPLAALPRLHLSENLLSAGDKAGAASALRTINAALLSDADQAALARLKSKLEIT